MDSNPEQNTQENKKTQGKPNLCRACKKEMPEGAKLCTECHSYQNWRRFLYFSNTVLSLLVALVAVAGIVSPIIYKTFVKKEFSDINVELLSVAMEFHIGEEQDAGEKIHQYRLNHLRIVPSFLVRNKGNLLGAIKKVEMVFNDMEGTTFHTMPFSVTQANSTIEPESARTASFVCDYSLHYLGKITFYTEEWKRHSNWAGGSGWDAWLKSYKNHPMDIFDKAAQIILVIEWSNAGDAGRKISESFDLKGHKIDIKLYQIIAEVKDKKREHSLIP